MKGGSRPEVDTVEERFRAFESDLIRAEMGRASGIREIGGQSGGIIAESVPSL